MKRYSVAMIAPCPFPANYGTPGAIREMSETLALRGHQVHIVTYPYGEDIPVAAAKIWRPWYWRKKVSLHSGPSYRKLLLDLLLLIKVCRVIRSERIAIIHAQNYEGVLIGFVAKLLTGRPLIYNAVNLMSDELPTYGFIKPAFMAMPIARFLDWLVTKLPDYFIAITKELRDAFEKRGIPSSRISYISLGVNAEMFQKSDPAPLLERYGIGQEPLVMYTGINSPFQRIDYLLRAFSVVVKAEPKARLMVVSPLKKDPDLATNRTLAQSLGIGRSVVWVEGQTLAELPDYLAMASVATMSRPDVPGHPIKLLNYMAAARPIVCFAGAAKGVRHMHEAYVVRDHDWQALGQGMVTLLRDRELAARLAATAKETVARDFDWWRLCTNIEDVYGSLAAAESESLELEPSNGTSRQAANFGESESSRPALAANGRNGHNGHNGHDPVVVVSHSGGAVVSRPLPGEEAV